MIRRFNRFELKYIITTAVRSRLWPEFLAHMSPDAEGEDGVYQVNSLYYDTFDLSCYRSKIEGLKFRRKLRVRRYGAIAPGENPIVMVEIKQRINRTTQKRRVALPLDQAYQLCDGDLDRSFDDSLDQAVADEVTYLALSRQLSPKCVISYRRRALVGSSFEPGLRVTSDEALFASDASCGLSSGAPMRRFVPADRAILEVKADNAVPLWLSRLLAANSVTVNRFSKYCAGIAHIRGERRWTS